MLHLENVIFDLPRGAAGSTRRSAASGTWVSVTQSGLIPGGLVRQDGWHDATRPAGPGAQLRSVRWSGGRRSGRALSSWAVSDSSRCRYASIAAASRTAAGPSCKISSFALATEASACDVPAPNTALPPTGWPETNQPAAWLRGDAQFGTAKLNTEPTPRASFLLLPWRSHTSANSGRTQSKRSLNRKRLPVLKSCARSSVRSGAWQVKSWTTKGRDISGRGVAEPSGTYELRAAPFPVGLVQDFDRLETQRRPLLVHGKAHCNRRLEGTRDRTGDDHVVRPIDTPTRRARSVQTETGDRPVCCPQQGFLHARSRCLGQLEDIREWSSGKRSVVSHCPTAPRTGPINHGSHKS